MFVTDPGDLAQRQPVPTPRGSAFCVRAGTRRSDFGALTGQNRLTDRRKGITVVLAPVAPSQARSAASLIGVWKSCFNGADGSIGQCAGDVAAPGGRDQRADEAWRHGAQIAGRPAAILALPRVDVADYGVVARADRCAALGEWAEQRADIGLEEGRVRRQQRKTCPAAASAAAAPAAAAGRRRLARPLRPPAGAGSAMGGSPATSQLPTHQRSSGAASSPRTADRRRVGTRARRCRRCQVRRAASRPAPRHRRHGTRCPRRPRLSESAARSRSAARRRRRATLPLPRRCCSVCTCSCARRAPSLVSGAKRPAPKKMVAQREGVRAGSCDSLRSGGVGVHANLGQRRPGRDSALIAAAPRAAIRRHSAASAAAGQAPRAGPATRPAQSRTAPCRRSPCAMGGWVPLDDAGEHGRARSDEAQLQARHRRREAIPTAIASRSRSAGRAAAVPSATTRRSSTHRRASAGSPSA